MKNAVGFYFVLLACGSQPASLESPVMGATAQGLHSRIIGSFPNDARCFDSQCDWLETFNKGAAFAINVAHPNQRISVPLQTVSLAQVNESTAWVVGRLGASLIDLATGEPRAEEVVLEQPLLKVVRSDSRMAWLLETNDGLRIEMRNLADGALLWSDELTLWMSITLQPEADLWFTADGETLIYIHPMWSVYAYDAATGSRAAPVATPKVSHVTAAFWNGSAQVLSTQELDACAFESVIALPWPNHVACVDRSSPSAVLLIDLRTGNILEREDLVGPINLLALFDTQTLRIAASVGLSLQISDFALER